MSLSLDLGKMMAQRSIVQQQIPVRAQIEWARILDNPTDIELNRGNTVLPIQTVRIEFDDTFTQQHDDASGIGNTKRAVLFGVRGHPDIDDLDIREWDTFVMDDKNYIVLNVNLQLQGQIQAEVEVT